MTTATSTTPVPSGSAPLLDTLVRYENDELDAVEEIEFFQDLVTSGLAWRLQGHYGRTAADFLEAGLIYEPGDEVADYAIAA